MSSINEIFFSEVRDKIQEVPSLVIAIPPLGNFIYRKAKQQRFKDSINEEAKAISNKILKMYEEYDRDKLNKRYEQHGKENHEAYLLAKKQGKVQRFQKNKPE